MNKYSKTIPRCSPQVCTVYQLLHVIKVIRTTWHCKLSTDPSFSPNCSTRPAPGGASLHDDRWSTSHRRCTSSVVVSWSRDGLYLDLGVDFESRLKSTWGYGVGSGRFHLGSQSNFCGVVCLFSSRLFQHCFWLYSYKWMSLFVQNYHKACTFAQTFDAILYLNKRSCAPILNFSSQCPIGSRAKGEIWDGVYLAIFSAILCRFWRTL